MKNNITRFLGRQPIFDTNCSVLGYEFLFSGGFIPEKEVMDFNTDSAIHITEAEFHFLGEQVEDFLKNNKLFLNLSLQNTTDHDESHLIPNQTVFEIHQPGQLSEDTIAYLKEIKEKGYQLAFGSFIFKKEYHLLLPLADYIKIDLKGISNDKLPTILEKIQHVSMAPVIVSQVNTIEQAEVCKYWGANFLQGHFYKLPKEIKKHEADTGKQSITALLEKIVDENISIIEIEKIILRDAGLTHKLLKLAKKYRTQKMPEFSSVKEIITLFGMKRVQAWATEIALCSLTDVTPEVFLQARIRSLFLRRMALAEKIPGEDSFAMAGIFSLLDCILNQTLEDALSELPINRAIKDGILNETGDYGRLLKQVKLFETFNGGNLNTLIKEQFLQSIKEAYDVAQ